ncbi:acyl carrier protein [Streptomyces sp. NPDC020362]|uniref:acyl carrier protein n=1 Tax=unclassified Streptomyces TaxID=2593676 RepID=UPI000AC2B9A9
MAMTLVEAIRHVAVRQELCGHVQALLVERFSLEADPAVITDDQPLPGRAWNSIDTLEPATAGEKTSAVTNADDDTQSLLSVNRPVDHIRAGQS